MRNNASLPKRLVIEGQAGAGKTPLCDAVKAELERRGYSVAYVHPFHEASALLGYDLYPLWGENPREAIDRLRAQLFKPREADVILYDRGWLTMQLALTYEDDLLPMALSGVRWWTVFLDVSLEVVQQRSTYRGEGGVLFNLLWDRERRSRLAPSCELVLVSDRRADLERFATLIVDKWLADTNT